LLKARQQIRIREFACNSGRTALAPSSHRSIVVSDQLIGSRYASKAFLIGTRTWQVCSLINDSLIEKAAMY
jgi:hypothetical protein